MKTLYIISFYILGTIFSSFLCVVGFRLPQKTNFIIGKSKCDTCNHELKFYEMIPILSYLFQKGKCRYCKCQIPPIIPISEIIGGLLFSLSYYKFGISYNTLIAICLSSLFIIVLVTDINYYIIPDEIIIFFSILLIIIQYLRGGFTFVLNHLITGVILFLVMYIVMIFGEKMFKKESLGGGDVKLLFLFGLVIDPMLGIITIFIASLIALPISLIILIKNKSNMIPFGPFLLLSLLLIYFSGITTQQFLNFII